MRAPQCQYSPIPSGSVLRRLLTLPYESLLVLSVAMLIGVFFPGAAEPYGMSIPRRHLFQGAIFATLCIYFMICWELGGHTLPMKTWKLRVVNKSGGQLSTWNALLRFLLALISFGSAGIGIAWAFIDPDRQFLHDRLCGTRIVATLG